MKLVLFQTADTLVRPGVLIEDGVVDASPVPITGSMRNVSRGH